MARPRRTLPSLSNAFKPRPISSPRPPSTVAEPPSPTTIRGAPRSSAARTSGAIPALVARMTSRRLRGICISPIASAASTTQDPSGKIPSVALRGRPIASRVLISSRRPPRPRTIASQVPSPPSASGCSIASQPAWRQPSAIALAASYASRAPRSLSGAQRAMGVMISRAGGGTKGEQK